MVKLPSIRVVSSRKRSWWSPREPANYQGELVLWCTRSDPLQWIGNAEVLTSGALANFCWYSEDARLWFRDRPISHSKVSENFHLPCLDFVFVYKVDVRIILQWKTTTQEQTGSNVGKKLQNQPKSDQITKFFDNINE